MDLRIIDRWRNVTIVPAKRLTTVTIADMDTLIDKARGPSLVNRQVEFVCDPEAYAAISALVQTGDRRDDEPEGPKCAPDGGLTYKGLVVVKPEG